MNFLVQSSFHAVECIIAYRAVNGISSLWTHNMLVIKL